MVHFMGRVKDTFFTDTPKENNTEIEPSFKLSIKDIKKAEKELEVTKLKYKKGKL